MLDRFVHRARWTWLAAVALGGLWIGAAKAHGEGAELSAASINPGGSGVIGTQVEQGVYGRFIRVENILPRPLGFGDNIQTSEIQAFAPGVVISNTSPPGTANYPDNANDFATLALGASFETSGGSFQHGADNNLINGIADTGANTWHRDGGNPTFFTVDLGQTRNLGTIRVWQRADGCCQDRLAHFTVSVLADDGGGNPGAVVGSQAYNAQPLLNSFGAVTMPDEFRIQSADILQIELGAGNLSDLLRVGTAGNGSLVIEPGATLELIALPGSGVGTFDVLDFGSVSGTFSSIIGPEGVNLDLSNLYLTGQVGVSFPLAPEPAAWALFALTVGAVALHTSWRRRSGR